MPESVTEKPKRVWITSALHCADYPVPEHWRIEKITLSPSSANRKHQELAKNMEHFRVKSVETESYRLED